MKALTVRKQCSKWLLMAACVLLAGAAQGETHPLPTGTEPLACSLTCPANMTVSTAPGVCVAVVNYTVTINDIINCIGPLIQTAGLPSGSNFPVGTTLNTFEIQGISGFENCSFNVTVEDLEVPEVLDCPSDMTANTDPGFCDAQVFWFLPNESDNCGVVSFGGTHNPGDIFPIGVTPVTYTATDPSGNNGFCTFNITVVDAELPAIFACADPACTSTFAGCPFPIFVNNDPGLCGAIVNWEPVIALDNCLGATITGTHAPGSTFPNGLTTVTYTATDAAGNASTCSFDVLVDDVEPPVLTCPDITVNNDPGACEAVVTISPTATDNCGIASVTSFPPSGSAFPWGTTLVSVTATDNAGMLSFCSFTLTVEDVEGPTFNNCPANTTVNNDPGFCGAFVNWAPPTVNDNCGVNSLTATHFPPDFFPIGTTTVTYTADDLVGNTATCVFDVTVVDSEPPSLFFCPADMIVATDFGVCTGTATWLLPSATDNCFIATLTATHNPGNVFPLGNTIVTYTATDAVGNISTCAFNVTVQDFEPPTIANCPADITASPAPGTCTATVNWVPPTATDNCGIASLTSANSPGDIFPVGGAGAPFTVIYTATDNAGSVTNCFFNVTVIDNEAPAMAGCPADINTTTSATFGICAGVVSWTDPVFTDNCGIGLSGSSHINGGFFPVGTTAVTIFAADFWGNVTNCIFNITLVDDEAPQIIPCPSNYIVDTDPGLCTAVVTWMPFTYFENCGVPTVTNSHNPGDAFPIGTTTVTYTATDAGGLSSSCIFDVIVNDAEPPSIDPCPANITLSSEFNNCTATVAWIPPSASDNCGATTLTSTHAPGSIFPVGTTTVTYTATDNAGLTAACSFDILVEDIFAPVITGCPGNVTVNADPGLCMATINWTAPIASDNCGMASFTSTHTPGSDFYGGITTVVYTATDINGLSATCFFIVTIVDTENPVINGCPTDITVNNDPGVCSAIVDWIPPTVTDNCAVPTIFSFFTPPAVFYLGTTPVSYTATDLFGLTAICSFNVTVSDIEPPSIMDCPSDILVNTDLGICSASATWAIPTMLNDNCGGLTMVGSHTPGDIFNLGSTTVTYSLTDFGGLTATCSFNITVTDGEAPAIASCPAGIAASTDPGACSASVSWAVPSASDNCGIASFSSTHAPGSIFPVGTTTVTYTATDNAGLTATCSFNITVTDGEAPAIASCPAGIAASTDPGACSASVSWAVPSASDNCGIASFSSTHAPGSIFPVGTTAVTHTATDNEGLTATCSFNITVTDGEAPAIASCPAGIAASTDPGACSASVSWAVPSASDNCGIASFSSTHAPGSIFPVGTTTVTYTATDNAGLTATCSFNITVTDGEAPAIASCPAGIAASTDPGACSASVSWAVPSASDNCGIASFSSTHAPGSIFPVGTTAVTHTATDNEGLTATCSFNITVTDGEAPAIASCPAGIAASTDPGACSASVSWAVPSASDNCGIASFSSTHAPGSIFPVGTTTVTYTATDNAGLTATCSFNITVTDGEAPAIASCPAGIAASTDPGACSASVSWAVPSASDNCGIASFSSTHAPGSIFPVGTTTVTYTATDNAGLTATCSFNITVTDGEAPAIASCPAGIAVSVNTANCSAVVTWLVPVVQENCSLNSFIATHSPGSIFPIGATMVTYTAIDQAGNSTECAFTVTVIDGSITTSLAESICQGQVYVVGNQSFGQTGTYQVVLSAANGCDSTVNLDLTVLPVFSTTLAESICQGQVYVVGNQSFSQTGNYQVVLSAANGCDSTVNLDLTVLPVFTTSLAESICQGQAYVVGNQSFGQSGNYQVVLSAANGCDSTVNLDLTVLPVFSTTLAESICQGQVYVVGNQSFGQTGNYQVVLSAANGCDSTVNLDLTVLPVFSTSLAESICQGQVYVVGNQSFGQTGTYQVVLSAANGCDSTVNLDLTVLPVFTTSLAESICQGQAYVVGNQSFSQTGNYQVVLSAANGCDSTVNLDLTVLPVFSTSLAESICQGQVYVVGNQSFGQTGTYQVVLSAANGCDSTVNLDLTVLPVFTTTLAESICQGQAYVVGNQSFGQTGNYQVVLSAANGCDSTVNLDLTVLPVFTTSLAESICQGQAYVVGNQSFGQSGNYQVVLSAANGCDSTVNLDLTVLPVFSTTLAESICQGQVYVVGNQSFGQTGNYQVVLSAANGCDSTVNLDLTVLPVFSTSLAESICQGQVYVVGNQSFGQTGTYQVVLSAANGCDSTVNLDLTVLPVFSTSLAESICQGQAYVVGNQSFSQTGNYQVVLSAANGCDSTVNLDLTVLPVFSTSLAESICQGQVYVVGNQSFGQTGTYQVVLSAANGCDSTVNLDLTVLPVFTTTLAESICQGQAYVVGNQSFGQSGTYQVVLSAANGCDSTVNLDLTVLPVFTTSLAESICQGQAYVVGNQSFGQSGNYQVVLSAANGCDSTVNLDLTVLPVFSTTLAESICQGQAYVVGNQSFGQTGNYQVVLSAANGCDSTVNLDLTVLPVFSTSLAESICQGQVYAVGNQSFGQTGTYQVVLSAANGCDSTVNLDLTVLPVFTTTLAESICQGQAYVVGNQSFGQSGTYQVVLSAANGCDSTVNLDLTVLPVFTTSLAESICQGQAYVVGNQSFGQSGNYQVVLSAANGCDSTVNLDLTVLPVFSTTLAESICQGQAYVVGNQSFGQTGNYQVVLSAANGCDSTVNLDLTVLPVFSTSLAESICQGQVYAVGNQSFGQTGTYQVVLSAANGCDSTVNLDLTVLPVFSTSLAESICQGQAYVVGNQSFGQTGNYTVTLLSAGGCDSIVNLNLTVFQNPDAMIFGPNSVCLGLSILLSTATFDAYAWSPGGETTPTIEVTAGGSYGVTVTDANGCTASAATAVAAENCGSVVAAFSMDQDTVCASNSVQFFNASSGGNTLYWDFGNGNSSNEPNPSAFYAAPGAYTVTLIVSDGITADTTERQVFVYPKLAAAFFTATPDPCAPKSLIFNDNTQSTFGLVAWSWNFGDGSSGSGSSVQHSYTNFDTVNVTQVVFDQFGCVDSVNQNVVVADLGTTPPSVHLCLNLCEGDSLVVGTTVFNSLNPLGSATLTAASGCDSLVTVELTFQPLQHVALTADFSICENETAVLDAGSGTSFLWSNGATSQAITISQPGNYAVTVADGGPCPQVREVVVSVDVVPTEIAVAGADIFSCETTEIVALNAQPATSGTGSWASFGTAEINNPANPGSTISNLSIGENHFVWTLTSGACEAFSADTVTVNVTAVTTEMAQAGDDQSFCNSVNAISLAAAQPQGPGITGQWSQPSAQAQLGIQILAPDNPNSPISGFFPNNTYLFTWTLTNGACGAYSVDNVLISTYAGLLPPADAGSDLNLCDEVETTLTGNQPPGAFGEWSALDAAAGAFISQPEGPSTLVGDLLAGRNAFVWTLSSAECPAYSADTVQVFLSEGLAANADVYFNLGQPLTRLDFLANDQLPDRSNVTLTFLSTPLYGSLAANGDGTYDFQFGVDSTVNIEFTYEICLKDCPDVCAQAQVLILSNSPLPPPAIEKPANVITPNEDGTGDRLSIPNYSEIPPPIDIKIINRWGNVVFQEKNYQNDWNGKTTDGKDLPGGTYFYILKGAGSEVDGAVTIVR